VTLRFCLDCGSHHASSYSCPKKEAKRYQASAARKARGRHAWRVARTEARQRDGQRCRQCGSSKELAVHHVRPISEGGERYALSNLITLCRRCHQAQHRGEGDSTGRGAALPRPSFSRKTPEARPRYSRSTLKNATDGDEAPFV
jgi:5-methylcytosine-specific restriction endonuclease McrA